MLQRFVLGLLCLVWTWGIHAQTQLQGTITEKENGELLIGATIKLIQGGEMKTGVISDPDGAYHLNLLPGVYDIEISYVGYSAMKIEGLTVYANQLNRLDVEMDVIGVTGPIAIVKYKEEIVKPDQIAAGMTFTPREIREASTRDVRDLIGQAPGVGQLLH